MRHSLWILLSATLCMGQASAQQLPAADAVRVREFYRLASALQDKIWPHWSDTPAPLLLVTDGGEFLTHHAAPPKGFTKVGDDFYARPRQFPTNLLATFPAFGPPSVIVIGEPANTTSKTSTPWLITVMHEHFHQLQNSQPGYFEDVNKLGLSRGDNSGMWMLNYPFPYADTSQQFAHLRNLLLAALAESDPQKFTKAAQEYLSGRKAFFGKLSADDHKYLGFQLWYEGIARYTEVRCAEAAAEYHPTAEFVALPDYESFADYAAKKRQDTLDELREADIGKLKRIIVYPWGAAEGFLLDRLKPGWRDEYFAQPFSLDHFFQP
jgi:hypothetical protein